MQRFFEISLILFSFILVWICFVSFFEHLDWKVNLNSYLVGIKEWQDLISGLIALLGALITIAVMNYHYNQDKKNNKLEYKENHIKEALSVTRIFIADIESLLKRVEDVEWEKFFSDWLEHHKALSLDSIKAEQKIILELPAAQQDYFAVFHSFVSKIDYLNFYDNQGKLSSRLIYWYSSAKGLVDTLVSWNGDERTNREAVYFYSELVSGLGRLRYEASTLLLDLEVLKDTLVSMLQEKHT